MIKDVLTRNGIVSQANGVEWGYGQVEPNHLSGQKTGQIYAQLPAKSDINILEQGQFVKYDLAAGVVNFTGPGEWMLVYNEIKLYRDDQTDCEFAMKKGDYFARIYSPLDETTLNYNSQTRYYGGKDSSGATIEKVTAPEDFREFDYNEDPYHIESYYKPKKMPAGTTMVPRVLKTNVGDWYTTNMVKLAVDAETGEVEELAVGGYLAPNASNYGILETIASTGIATADMVWQIAKVYTMPDTQKGYKIIRVK